MARRRAELAATPLLPRPAGSDARLVGTAFEYLVAGAVGAEAKRTVIRTRSLTDATAVPAAVDSAHAAIAALRTRGAVEDAVSGALMLAELEHLGRRRLPVPERVMAWRPSAGPPPGTREATLADLHQLATAAVDDFADLHGADPLRFGPVLRSRAHVRGDSDGGRGSAGHSKRCSPS